MGLRFYTNFLDDFGFGTGISGGLKSIFSWNVGYSYNGEGLNKKSRAFIGGCSAYRKMIRN